MSDESWAMPTEAVQDTVLAEDNIIRRAKRLSVSSGRAGNVGNLMGCRVEDITMADQGVYASECLSLGRDGKVPRGKWLLPPTGLGKSDRPG